MLFFLNFPTLVFQKKWYVGQYYSKLDNWGEYADGDQRKLDTFFVHVTIVCFTFLLPQP